jgi:HAD superfamily hydrolase (TIGR01490 family)
LAQAQHIAAFFDVDRTLVVPRSMEQMFIPFLIRQRYLRAGDLARYLGFMARAWSTQEMFHGNKYYLKNKDPRELDRLAAECFRTRIRPRVSPAGRRAVARHRRAGHLVILVTGSLMPLAQQMRRELGADLAVAASLAEEGGSLLGTLTNRRPYGAEKARVARELARTHRLDLGRSFAYGDHHSDQDLLELVGNPRAVNPNPGLRLAAQRHGWPILKF